MRAITYATYGDESVLTLDPDHDNPKPGPGELLVRVKAVGVNPVDWQVVEGRLEGHIDLRLPAIPGWDVAGVVEAGGGGVEEFMPGDEVFSYARLPVVQQGTYAEFVVVPEKYLALRPQNGSWAQTGGLPLAGLTALQSLAAVGVGASTGARVGVGEIVLIHAAAGGVGSVAVQIAKAKGARVIGTASPRNHEYVSELGAEPVEYGPGLEARLRELAPDGIDAVADYIGGDAIERSVALVKDPTRMVSVVNPKVTEVGGTFVFTQPDAKGLKELARLVDEKELEVHVQQELPLEKAAEAFQLSKQGRTRGKLVLVPDLR
ncbi:NADP-dependent oxidoreductase [Actinospica durhamensis]|uniref:NADP-dependent oxidoreductase n=1 Tax=Actinospica durhamensis TaxID=1508375 RepID=A0A941EUT2_9ACTN|nr:NADP-dependent oxidoreductase [Actinospica durhamensis]MBR7838090.1 NADP-dependent oxidoreductase [Actinospica durhamensis]